MDFRETQNSLKEELLLLRFDLTISYHMQLPKQLPGLITRVMEIVKHRVLLEQERQMGPLTPGSTTHQVTSHHAEPLTHTPVLRVTRRSVRLMGATKEKDLPEIIIVRNSVTAFFKPCQEANPFELHATKCL